MNIQIKQAVYSLEEIDAVVAMLHELMATCKIFAFEGPLGAGKTTIIKALLKKCGVQQTVTSPTFTYVNVYENSQHQLFYHFDLYRIDSLDGFMQLGFNEFLYAPNSWALVEWPEIIKPLLTHHVCIVNVDYAPEGLRAIQMSLID